MNYFSLAIYLLVLIGIGIWSSRKSTTDKYLIANREVGAVALGFSISAGFFDGFILVSYTGYVYKYGWPAVSLFFGTVLGFILFYIFAEKIQTEGYKNKYYGMSDYFEFRFGHTSAIIVSLINCVFYVSLLLIQLIFGSTVLSEVTGWSYNLCIFIVGVTILLYVALGGLKAVLSTDKFQWILIGVILIVFLPVLIREGFSGSLGHANFRTGTSDAIGFLLIGTMACFSAPELWQRCFAGRDLPSVKKGISIAGFAFPLIGILLALIGFYAFASYPNIEPQNALVSVFKGMFEGPFGSFGLILLLSAIMSTADTSLFVISPTVVLNILKIKDQSKKKYYTLITVIIAMIIGIGLGLVTRDILSIALSLASLSLALFPVLFFSLIAKLTSNTVNISLLLGILAVIGLIASGEITPTTSLVSLPVVLISVIIGWAWNLFKNKKRNR